MLRHVRNPSAPSTEEVWQSLREYRAGIPERLARWKQAEQASRETLAPVEQHEPSSRDIRDTLKHCALVLSISNSDASDLQFLAFEVDIRKESPDVTPLWALQFAEGSF